MGGRGGGGRGGGGSGEEDDTTTLFFLLSLLVCVVGPWTLAVLWSLIWPGAAEVEKTFPTTTEKGLRVRNCQTQAMSAKREAHIARLRSRRAMCTRGFLIRTAILGLLWCWLAYIVFQLRTVLATSSMYANFDPYELLNIGRSAGKAEVKKAFRKLSLQLHPDKNPDPSAVEKFILVKKAYDSLTDPVSARNYKLYGNPDGPTRVEIGMAIPSIGKDQQGIVLLIFLFGFILGVPLTMMWCLKGSESEVAPNGVLKDTMEALANALTASTDVRALQALLLSSGESCAIPPPRSSEEAEALSTVAQELKVKVAKGATEVRKADVLFLAHIQRCHGKLSSPLLEDLNVLLEKWRLICRAMLEIAAAKALPSAHEAALELHRALAQAVDPGSASSGSGGAELLQVPHLDAEQGKKWRKGPRKAANLTSFAEMTADDRRTSLEAVGLNSQELLDAEEFAKAVPRISISQAKVFVAGEDLICEDDIATVRLKFVRENLAEGEASGAAHTPFFPDAVISEAWWLSFTVVSRGGKTRLVRVKDMGRDAVAELRFKVASAGKYRARIKLLSEAYVGLDAEHDVHFEVKTEKEAQKLDQTRRKASGDSADDGSEGSGGEDDDEDLGDFEVEDLAE